MDSSGLVERQEAIAALEDRVASCRSGQGSVVELVGEAGAGKSTLVDVVRKLVDGSFPVYVGHCADLRTPVSLAPFAAVARHAAALGQALDQPRPAPEIAETLITELLDTPAVLVLEDLHWADEATADVLAVLVRRSSAFSGLLVLTYRPLAVDDPMRAVAGQPGATRVAVEPLTKTGVAAIVGAQRADELYRLTGGNPYFVSELAAEGDGDDHGDSDGYGELPASVSEAVLRQVAALEAAERKLLELLSCVPSGARSELLDATFPEWRSVVDRPEQLGVVRFTDALRFRHELGRRAVLDSLGGARSSHLHRQIGASLERIGAQASELIHYAVVGDDVTRILEYGPPAARELSNSGAHRAAATLLAAVLKHRPKLGTAAEAACFEQLSYEHWALAEGAEADRAAEMAALAFAAANDPVGEANALRSRANYALGLGKLVRSFYLRQRAIDLLEPLGPSAELIMALSDESGSRCSTAEWDLAEAAGRRALRLAEELGDTEALVQAIYGYGYLVVYTTGDETTMRRGITFGGDTTVQHTAVGLANLAFAHVERADLRAAALVAAEARAFADRHDLSYVLHFLEIIDARIDFEAGRWPAAEQRLRELEPNVAGTGLEIELPVAIWMAFLAVRQGWNDADQRVEAAATLASAGVELVHRVPLVLLLCEHAWLRGELGRREQELLQPCAVFFERPGLPWAGALAYWMSVAGGSFDVGGSTPGHQLAEGDWAAAAEGWAAVDHPYEQAMALGTSDNVEALREAIEVFDNLGAVPMADRTRARLRDIDPAAVPKRPKRTRSSDPTRLSKRQLDVLRLLAEHRTNAEIAERLYVSIRTVDHHVSAILTKMGVANRREAAIEATRRGLLPTDGDEN